MLLRRPQGRQPSGPRCARTSRPRPAATTSSVEGVRTGQGLQLTGDDAVHVPGARAPSSENATVLDRPVGKYPGSNLNGRSSGDARGPGPMQEAAATSSSFSNGRLSVALVHFDPGNSIRVIRPKEPLPGQQVAPRHVMTYDGSSRGGRDCKLWLDGKPLSTPRSCATSSPRTSRAAAIPTCKPRRAVPRRRIQAGEGRRAPCLHPRTQHPSRWRQLLRRRNRWRHRAGRPRRASLDAGLRVEPSPRVLPAQPTTSPTLDGPQAR